MTKHNMTFSANAKTARVIYPLFYAVLFALLFAPSFQLMLKWWDKDDYNYCYFVPLLTGYLLWERRQALRLPSVPSWGGVVIVALGILFYLLGELGAHLYSVNLSSWVILVGLLWLHFGWHKLRGIFFPICFLLAMFPLPNAVNNTLTMKLKMVSSTLGVKILQVMGVTVFQEGNIIDIGFTKLQVVEACSGLRYLLPLIIVGLLLAAQHRCRLWQRSVLVLSAVPLSILINSLRITCIAWLYPVLGAGVVEGVWHDFIGWALFMASVGCLLGERWLLLKLAPVGFPQHVEVVVSKQPRAIRQLEVWPMALVALLMLGSTAIAVKNVNFHERVPLIRPMIEFPMVVQEWRGERSNLEQVYLDALKLSDYLLADYVNAQGKVVNLYVAYYESQNKDVASHSPDVCLSGSGWFFRESGTTSIPIAMEYSLAKVNRVFIEKNGERIVGYYWYPQRGRILANPFQLKWYTFWDALTKQRTDGALVRMLTTVQAGEQPAEAEARLQDFVRQLGPQLNSFLPGR